MNDKHCGNLCFFERSTMRTYGAAEGLGRAEIVVATANLLAYVKAKGQLGNPSVGCRNFREDVSTMPIFFGIS